MPYSRFGIECSSARLCFRSRASAAVLFSLTSGISSINSGRERGMAREVVVLRAKSGRESIRNWCPGINNCNGVVGRSRLLSKVFIVCCKSTPALNSEFDHDESVRPKKLLEDKEAVGPRSKVVEEIKIATRHNIRCAGSYDALSFNGMTDWIRFVGRAYNGEHNEVNRATSKLRITFATLRARVLRWANIYSRYCKIASKSDAVVCINQVISKQIFPRCRNPIWPNALETPS
jgi:hypothetical protein